MGVDFGGKFFASIYEKIGILRVSTLLLKVRNVLVSF